MRSTDPDSTWRIPCVTVMEMKLPDGQAHLAVTGQDGHIQSYLSRFGVVPAIYGDEKKLVRPAAGGKWEILDLDACPELSEQPKRLAASETAGQTLVKCQWQLVGYTTHRVLVRLLFNENGEGHWLIAHWGFRDISPDLKDGYFNYTLKNNVLEAKWPDDGVSSFSSDVFRKINICSAAQGGLAFFDYELAVDRHIVPEHVCDLNGWPLIYWGTEHEETIE